jgi:hypothetical protein
MAQFLGLETVGHRAATVEPARVVRLPEPALAHMIRMRGQGYGWEDAAVYLQREGILVSNADIRSFFLGPRRTTASQGGNPERPLEAVNAELLRRDPT